MINELFDRRTALTVLMALSALATPAAWGQGVPLPGQSSSQSMPWQSAPVPGASAPAPGPGRPGPQPAAGAAASAYAQLPLSVSDTQARIDELKSLLPEARPQDIQDSIIQLCEWLADIADAHNRLAASFSKNDATKAYADAERQAAHRFSQLKNQAQLLKADLLIKQRRFPEALAPLVEIVVTEPRSSTGAAAYKRLKEIGFAEEPVVKAEPTTPGPQLPAATGSPLATTPAKTPTRAPDAVHVAQSSKRPAARTATVRISRAPAGRRAQSGSAARSGRLPDSDSVWLPGSPFGGTSKTRISRR